MSTPRSPWSTLCAAALLLGAAACTRASDGLSGASVPQTPAGDAAALGAVDAASDTTAGGAVDPLAARPIPTPKPYWPPIRLSNPANPIDALGALHNEGVEALLQQRAAWVVQGRVDERKALALTIAWLCQSKAKLPTLPPWGPSTGPTIPTDPCDPRWPTVLQALPIQRTLPIEQIYALAGYDADARGFVDAILAEQAAALASNADPSARIAAIVRLEAGLRGGGANPLGAGDVATDTGAPGDGAAGAAGTALTDTVAADVAAAGGVTDAAGTDGGIDGAIAVPRPTVSPDPCRYNPMKPKWCVLMLPASVARHSLGYWYAERTSTSAPRWNLLPVTPPARQSAPAPTPKPKDWGKIGKADVAGAGAGGAVGGFWGGLIGAVLFSAVEGFTQ